jgi:hypothetical protein
MYGRFFAYNKEADEGINNHPSFRNRLLRVSFSYTASVLMTAGCSLPAAAARAIGDCATASSIYQTFINELKAQSGKKVDAATAEILIADAQYLMTHCP